MGGFSVPMPRPPAGLRALPLGFPAHRALPTHSARSSRAPPSSPAQHPAQQQVEGRGKGPGEPPSKGTSHGLPDPGVRRGRSPRQQTCSAHVTPAMPPPTTTNVPTDRAASMLPGGRPRAADCAPVTCEPSSTRKGSCPHSHFRRPFHGLWTTGAWKLHT